MVLIHVLNTYIFGVFHRLKKQEKQQKTGIFLFLRRSVLKLAKKRHFDQFRKIFSVVIKGYSRPPFKQL